MQSYDTKTELTANPKMASNLSQLDKATSTEHSSDNYRNNYIEWYSIGSGLPSWYKEPCQQSYFKNPPIVKKTESHEDLGYVWLESKNGWTKNMYLSPDDDRSTEILIRKNDNDTFELTIKWASGISDLFDMEFVSFGMANALAMSRIKETMNKSKS